MVELDTRLLRYFLRVAELGSFTDAAEELHVSQPALSQGIRRLETLLGVTLLDRGPRGATRASRLTPSGEAFRRYASEIVTLCDRAVISTQAAARVQLTVGFGTSVPRLFTSLALRAAVAVGQHEPVLEYVPWGEEISWLTSGRVDLVFLQAKSGLMDDRLEVLPLVEMRRVAVFAASHPLAARQSVDFDDLRDEPIIDAASDRDYWLVNPRPDGSRPVTVGPAARTVDEMLALVSAGRGMAITSSSVAERYQSSDLAFVPIVNLDAGMLYLARDANDHRPQVMTMQLKTASLIGSNLGAHHSQLGAVDEWRDSL